MFFLNRSINFLPKERGSNQLGHGPIFCVEDILKDIGLWSEDMGG
jgi:hypothetical protein